LLFSSVRGVWRLRYAAADDEDPYGGSVTLVHIDANLGLQAGQHVRVKGKLINPATSEPSPYYHVLEMERSSQESGVRSQESGVRSQESGIR